MPRNKSLSSGRASLAALAVLALLITAGSLFLARKASAQALNIGLITTFPPVVQAPLGPDSPGAQNSMIGTTEADLLDGDLTYDTEQIAILMVMNEDKMYCVHQPKRKVSKSASFTWSPANHDQKNVVVESTSSTVVVSLENDTSVVPSGTVVRIYHAASATSTVSVRFGTAGLPSASIASGHSSEFVFTGGAWRSTYHDVAFVAQ